jgi:L-asparaginase
MSQTQPKLHVVATGGTIANTSAGRVAIEDIIETIPEASALATFETTHVCRVGSAELTDDHWLEVARAVDAAASRGDVAGVLVTHGTFTHEETAYFLHLTIRTEKPIVVVSSQRKHGSMGNDGDRNFLDAVRVALAAESRGLGVLSVLNEDVHTARDVVKTSPRPDGFRSRAHGPLGHVDTDRVVYYRTPTRRHTARSEFDVGALDTLPRVDVIHAYPGADAATVEPLLDAAAPAGVVVAGYAFSGMPAIGQVEALTAAAESGVAVVCANRGLEGRVPFPLPESRTAGRGFVHGDDLPPHKARILLQVALTTTRDTAELQRIFDEY